MWNKIKFYRLKKGYKLSYVAQMVGISEGYLCHLERGTRDNPSYKIMQKISLVLGEDISKIFS